MGTDTTLKNWDRDLTSGLDGEVHVCRVISTAEIKTDFETGDTGNVAIEVWRELYPKGSKKYEKTGLSISTANYWIFNLHGKFNQEVIIAVKTSRLKRLIKKYKSKIRKVWGGDDNRSYLYLLKKEWLLDEC